MNVLISPRRSLLFGPLFMAMGVLGVAVGGWSLVQAGDAAVLTRVVSSVLPALFGALLFAGGRMIAAQRGGVGVEDEAYVLVGDSAPDRIRVPLDRCRSIMALRLDERWGEQLHTRWVCEALVTDAPRVLLGESDDEHGLKHVAHNIASAGGLGAPLLEPPADSPPSRPEGPPPPTVTITKDQLDVLVGLGGNLASTLLVGGISMLVVGVILMLDIANNNVFGFLFGPLLAILGVILAAVPVAKRRLTEHLRVKGATLYHNYEAFGFSWGHREFPLVTGCYVRVRQRGLQGANLEVVSDGRILHVAGGVHNRTPLGPAGLFWTGQFLSWLIAEVGEPQAKAPAVETDQEGNEPSQDSMQNS